jgi:hypothetical protein
MPSKLDPHVATIGDWLAAEPQLTALACARIGREHDLPYCARRSRTGPLNPVATIPLNSAAIIRAQALRTPVSATIGNACLTPSQRPQRQPA